MGSGKCQFSFNCAMAWCDWIRVELVHFMYSSTSCNAASPNFSLNEVSSLSLYFPELHPRPHALRVPTYAPAAHAFAGPHGLLLQDCSFAVGLLLLLLLPACPCLQTLRPPPSELRRHSWEHLWVPRASLQHLAKRRIEIDLFSTPSGLEC